MKGPRRRKSRVAETPVPTAVPPKKNALQKAIAEQKVTFLPSCRLEMVENREATLEGCRGVLEYDENCIKLSCDKMTIRFIGRELYIRCLTADTAQVEGVIVSVDFGM